MCKHYSQSVLVNCTSCNAFINIFFIASTDLSSSAHKASSQMLHPRFAHNCLMGFISPASANCPGASTETHWHCSATVWLHRENVLRATVSQGVLRHLRDAVRSLRKEACHPCMTFIYRFICRDQNFGASYLDYNYITQSIL